MLLFVYRVDSIGLCLCNFGIFLELSHLDINHVIEPFVEVNVVQLKTQDSMCGCVGKCIM